MSKRVKTKYGEMLVMPDDLFIGKSLKHYGEYCEGEPELWRRLVFSGDIVVDVGANIGALTLPLSHMVGAQGKVIAIEAQQQNYLFLESNIKEHNNIIPINKAMGSVAGKTCIPTYSDIDHTNFGRMITGTGTQEVEVDTLDNSLKECFATKTPWLINCVSFIKIDVEGDELEVLRGAQETINTNRPILYVENDRPEKSVELLKFIRSMDYKIYEHNVALFREENWVGNKVNVLGGDFVSMNVLCIPKEKYGTYKHVTDELSLIVPASLKVGKTGWAGVARFGGIGDNLIAASVLRPLKAKGYKIDVLSQEPQSCVFENNPFIDKLSIKDPVRDLPQGNMQAWQDWFISRSHEYDLFVNLSHSCESLAASFPAMTSFSWPAKFRRKQFGGSYLEKVHDIINVPYDFGPLFFPTDDELDKAFETKRKIGSGNVVGWCLSGTRLDKLYPHSPLAIARIIKELDANVVMFGAPPPSKDHDFAAHVQEHVKQQNGSDKGLFEAITTDKSQWPIRRILTFAGVCDLVISPDTGPAWSVAFEPMPKIVLLSHASPENITKHWKNTITLHADPDVCKSWPCHLLHDTIDTCIAEQIKCGMTPNLEYKEKKIAACITDINVELLVTAAKSALGSKSATVMLKNWASRVTLGDIMVS